MKKIHVGLFALLLGSMLGMTAFSGIASAAGDPKAGEKTVRACLACHSLEAGKSRPTGPTLHGVVGRTAGTAAKFRYSRAMNDAREKGLVWTEELIVQYVEDPKKFLQGYLEAKRVSNKMVFKLKPLQLRENVVAYLKTLSENEE